MKQSKVPRSIWDIDPRHENPTDVVAIEILFLDAWEYSFFSRPAVSRVQPYLDRYFRFRVVPPWVAVFVRERLRGEAIDNIANAPLDPAIDLRLYPWQLVTKLVLPIPFTGHGRRGRFGA